MQSPSSEEDTESTLALADAQHTITHQWPRPKAPSANEPERTSGIDEGAETVVISKKPVSTRKLLSQAIKELSQGKADTASHKLQAILAQDPDHFSANEFMKHITIDPVSAFGKNYFYYQVRRGETMSQIAERFTKNHLNFYLLSRYNNIADPRNIVMGQKLKIPAMFNAKNTHVFESTSRSYTKVVVKVDELISDERFLDAIAYIQSQPESIRNSNQIKQSLMSAYQGESRRLQERNELERAKLILQKAYKLSSESENIEQDLARLNQLIKAKSLLRLSKLHLRSGQLETAIDNIEESLRLNPNQEGATATRQTIKQQLIDRYHTTALEYYQNNQAPQAIAYWNKVLGLEPSNLIAKSYLQKARLVAGEESKLELSLSQE